MGRRNRTFAADSVRRGHPDIAADSVDARKPPPALSLQLVAVLPLSMRHVRITRPEAAEILDVHPQTVAKMVARGDLTSHARSRVRGSLDRDEALALAVPRKEAAERRQREREAAPSRRPTGTAQPPDAEHPPHCARRRGRTPATFHRVWAHLAWTGGWWHRPNAAPSWCGAAAATRFKAAQILANGGRAALNVPDVESRTLEETRGQDGEDCRCRASDVHHYVVHVNAGRILTPFRRLKIDPLGGHGSSVDDAGTRPRSRSLSR